MLNFIKWSFSIDAPFWVTAIAVATAVNVAILILAPLVVFLLAIPPDITAPLLFGGLIVAIYCAYIVYRNQ